MLTFKRWKKADQLMNETEKLVGIEEEIRKIV